MPRYIEKPPRRLGVKLLRDIHPAKGSTSLRKDNKLLEHETVAAGLILSGVAAEQPRLKSTRAPARAADGQPAGGGVTWMPCASLWRSDGGGATISQ